MNRQMWNEYLEAKYSNNMSKKIAVYTKCLEQTEDPSLTIAAKRELGAIYFQQYHEQNSEESLEKARKYLKEAADAGDDVGNQLYGILLYNEGNFDAFDYLLTALKLGNIYSAYALQDNLHMQQDFPLARKIKEHIKQSVEDIVSEYEQLSEGNSRAEFVLALIGLYDLGEHVGLDCKKGMDYLNQAAKRGDERAILMKKNPVLLKPETMNQFEMPSAEELKEMDKQSYGLEETQENVPEKRRSGIGKIVLVVALLLAVFLFGKTVWDAVTTAATSVFHVLRPFLCVAFLLVIAYIAYGDERSSSKKSDNDWDPIKEYNDNHDCNRMPNYIYDSSQNGWSKVYVSGNVAVYSNYDYGEDKIHYCDISGHYAVGRRGDYHWY